MYNKLFTKILDSSIWLEADATRIVWITLIAAMDEDGMARFSSIANLAHRARESIRATEKAVAVLEAPDVNSDREEHQGRRIERVPGGWLVLNASYYRNIVTRLVSREQTRMRVQRYRERSNGENVTDVTGVTCNDASVYVYASPKEERSAEERRIPDCLASVLGFPEEWKSFQEHRRGMKKIMGPKSEKLNLNILAKRPTEAVSLLQMAIARGWQGIDWEWYDKNKPQKPKRQIAP